MRRIARKLKAPKGLALAIFVALVLVAVAQISWWIYFQVMISKEQASLFDRDAHTTAHLTATMLNHCFDRMITHASMFAKSNEVGQIKSSFDQLRSDPAVIGYVISDSTGKMVSSSGSFDSSMYCRLGGRYPTTLFLNSDYPAQLTRELNPDLSFDIKGKRGNYSSPWFSDDMFSLKPGVLAQVKEKEHRRVFMFTMEGSFFVFLTLLGAFLIYRTLHQSEELKLQQENFIHAVTHELKIPVASIKLYLETLSSPKIDKEKTQSIIPRMIDDCFRLEALVDNVLEAGRLSRHSQRLKLSRANLSADLEEYLEELRPLIERQRMKLESAIEPDIYVKSDYQAIKRVVTALVDNAIKYSPEGRRELKISAKRDEVNCQIAFADKGVGIDLTEQRKVFDLFYRTGMENTRTVKGTGLGLYLVKEIVSEHGGSVTVHSDGSDTGSTFTITMPLDKEV